MGPIRLTMARKIQPLTRVSSKTALQSLLAMAKLRLRFKATRCCVFGTSILARELKPTTLIRKDSSICPTKCFKTLPIWWDSLSPRITTNSLRITSILSSNTSNTISNQTSIRHINNNSSRWRKVRQRKVSLTSSASRNWVVIRKVGLVVGRKEAPKWIQISDRLRSTKVLKVALKATLSPLLKQASSTSTLRGKFRQRFL